MKKTSLLILLTLIILALLFLFFRPQDTNKIKLGNKASPSPTYLLTPTIAQNNFDIVVVNGQVMEAPSVFKVTEGEEVTLNISSDTKDELHIHGYNKFLTLNVNEKSQLKFTANVSGRFPLELHGSGKQLGILEVIPLVSN